MRLDGFGVQAENGSWWRVCCGCGDDAAFKGKRKFVLGSCNPGIYPCDMSLAKKDPHEITILQGSIFEGGLLIIRCIPQSEHRFDPIQDAHLHLNAKEERRITILRELLEAT